MPNEKYYTVAEVAEYLKSDAKTVRENLIEQKRIRYLQLGRKYLIEAKSFHEWEESNLTRVVKRW